MIIKHGRYSRYYPSRKSNYVETENNFEELRKKGVCFICKEKGHMSFNCPNKKNSKSIKRIRKSTTIDEDKATTSLKKIKSVKYKKKDNVIDFYIKTNDIKEQRVRVLVDSGSDLNFIHPEFSKLCGIKLEKFNKSFGVSGLGYGISKMKKETEKYILRHKNHFEVIKFYALRIPDVDIILRIPWIEKHSPTNYLNSKKINFSSYCCGRHCNNGKRKRKTRKDKEKEPENENEDSSDSDFESECSNSIKVIPNNDNTLFLILVLPVVVKFL